jgi:hypothetical protein
LVSFRPVGGWLERASCVADIIAHHLIAGPPTLQTEVAFAKYFQVLLRDDEVGFGIFYIPNLIFKAIHRGVEIALGFDDIIKSLIEIFPLCWEFDLMASTFVACVLMSPRRSSLTTQPSL